MSVRLGDILLSAVSTCALFASPPFGSRALATNGPAAFASAGGLLGAPLGCTGAASVSRESSELHLLAEACSVLLASAYPQTSP